MYGSIQRLARSRRYKRLEKHTRPPAVALQILGFPLDQHISDFLLPLTLALLTSMVTDLSFTYLAVAAYTEVASSQCTCIVCFHRLLIGIYFATHLRGHCVIPM